MDLKDEEGEGEIFFVWVHGRNYISGNYLPYLLA
jgi:hypothetical protein